MYQLINEEGFERFRIDLMEDYPCEDKQSLRQREGYWIREIETLNKRVESRTTKEYYNENKNDIQIYKKIWYDENIEKIKIYKT